MGTDARPTIIFVDPALAGIDDNDGVAVAELARRIGRVRGVAGVQYGRRGILDVLLTGRLAQQGEAAEAVGRIVRHARKAAGLPTG